MCERRTRTSVGGILDAFVSRHTVRIRAPSIPRAKGGGKIQSQGHFPRTGSFPCKGPAFPLVNWVTARKWLSRSLSGSLPAESGEPVSRGTKDARLGSMSTGSSPGQGSEL